MHVSSRKEEIPKHKLCTQVEENEMTQNESKNNHIILH